MVFVDFFFPVISTPELAREHLATRSPTRVEVLATIHRAPPLLDICRYGHIFALDGTSRHDL